MKKEIPNVDGVYKTRDGSIAVTVTRKVIEFDIAAAPAVHIIDDEPASQKTKSRMDSMDRTKKVIKNINEILMGES